MPIRSLESFLFESKLVYTSSIEVLQNATIGIDAEHYLSRIYTYKKEQFLSGVGGAPTSLNSYIQSDLEVFTSFNIRPLFVLPGLKIVSRNHSASPNFPTPQEEHVNATWMRLQSRHTASRSHFGGLGESFRQNIDPLPIDPIINDLVLILIENGIDYLISPYDAAFQLSHMYSNKTIDCIYGSTDVLLTEVDKFILGMEFQSKDFRFVDKSKMLSELRLTNRQFLDISIIVGCSIQPTTFSHLPPVPKPSPMSPFPTLCLFRLVLDVLYQLVSISGGSTPDLFGYVKSLGDPALADLYLRGHAAFKFMPILNSEGFVAFYSRHSSRIEQSMNKPIDQVKHQPAAQINRVPSELHEVISQRLPSEFYFYQSIGLLTISLMEAISTGNYFYRPPLDGITSESYKDLVTSKLASETLSSQLNILTQLLARYYQVKTIKLLYWFTDNHVDVNNRTLSTTSASASKIFSKPKKHPQFSMRDLICESRAPSQSAGTIGGSNELVSTALLRAFRLMGVTDTSSTGSCIIRILHKFLDKRPDVSDADLELLLELLVLIQNGSLSQLTKADGINSVPHGFMLGGTDQNLTQSQTNLVSFISKIFSLSKFDIHPINYQGPISRSLLHFRSHLKLIHDMILDSLRTCLVDVVSRSDFVKSSYSDRDLWSSLIKQLPFYKDLNNTLMGVMAEIYLVSCLRLSNLGNLPNQSVASSKEHLMESILQVSKSLYNINLNSVNSVTSAQLTSDFTTATKFWHCVVDMLDLAHAVNDLIVTTSDMEFVRQADELVRKFSFF